MHSSSDPTTGSALAARPDTRARQAAVLGALVADAAALGLHWLYDADRLRQLQHGGALAFRSPDAAHYAGVRGYYAHGGKHAGDLSPYGRSCRLMLSHLAGTGGVFRRRQYQQEWLACFGPGGSWVGYADRPTRGTVARLLACASPDAFPALSGVDDDQLPALECIAPMVACHRGSLDTLIDAVLQAVAVTHDHPLARDAATACVIALHQVLAGTPMAVALSDAAASAGAVLRPLLEQALAMPALDAQGASARFGMPCHLPQGLPVLFHIARHAASYGAAVEANVLAGGDSCGRSLMLGALCAGADALAQSAGPQRGGVPPLAWLSQLCDLRGIVRDLESLLPETA